MVAVLGISESSKADLVSTLDRLGTNLLQVTAGPGLLRPGRVAAGRGAGRRPHRARAGGRGRRPVDATVRRTDLIPEGQTGGIAVYSADTNLLETLGGTIAPARS